MSDHSGAPGFPDAVYFARKQKTASLSQRQREMLRAFDRDGEATDFADFDNAGTLAWRNRERVIDALRRKGLLDDNGVTDAGRHALAAQR